MELVLDGNALFWKKSFEMCKLYLRIRIATYPEVYLPRIVASCCGSLRVHQADA
jgi:hypothetical protein